MSSNAVFISYSRNDQISYRGKNQNWLDRLKPYLGQFRQEVDIWDDTRIRISSDWRSEINAAMNKATDAILLVGPEFLASEFITEYELPSLLAAADRGTKMIYPLVVGHCAYKNSRLDRYAAVNNPAKPLEVLSEAEQNEILNNLSLTVCMRRLQEATKGGSTQEPRDTEWQYELTKEYSRTDGYMLVHVCRPSTVSGQKFDILIFVVRHRKGSEGPPKRNFDEIQKAEFFFGDSWGNKVFPVDNTPGGLLGVWTHAWGTFFAACRITFTDPNRKPIILYRYIDFEMAPIRPETHGASMSDEQSRRDNSCRTSSGDLRDLGR
jgi:hypothetical protein